MPPKQGAKKRDATSLLYGKRRAPRRPKKFKGASYEIVAQIKVVVERESDEPELYRGRAVTAEGDYAQTTRSYSTPEEARQRTWDLLAAAAKAEKNRLQSQLRR